MENYNIKIFRPFGPSVAKISLPTNIIKNLNDYVDEIIKEEDKIKKLDHGKKLAGNVKQELKLESEFIENSGLLKFLSTSVSKWINLSRGKKISKFNLIASWVVRQFQNEYNPLHLHGGHVSGVGYLKVPKNLGETFQKEKVNNHNGKIILVHGVQMFNSSSMFTLEQKVGDFYFFPNYLMHTVYPFYDSDEERRSVSFNAVIDENIYNTYNTYG